MTEIPEINDQILRCKIKPMDEVELKLMEDEKMAHNIAWQGHCNVTDINYCKKAIDENKDKNLATSAKSAKSIKSLIKTTNSLEKDNLRQEVYQRAPEA